MHGVQSVDIFNSMKNLNTERFDFFLYGILIFLQPHAWGSVCWYIEFYEKCHYRTPCMGFCFFFVWYINIFPIPCMGFSLLIYLILWKISISNPMHGVLLFLYGVLIFFQPHAWGSVCWYFFFKYVSTGWKYLNSMKNLNFEPHTWGFVFFFILWYVNIFPTPCMGFSVLIIIFF